MYICTYCIYMCTHCMYLLIVYMYTLQIPVTLYILALVIKGGFRVTKVDPEFKRLINSESKPILKDLTEKGNTVVYLL